MKLRINIVLFLLLNCLLFSSVAMGAGPLAKKKKKKVKAKATLTVQEELTPEQQRRYDSVSYTHLDVYKRQLINITFIPKNKGYIPSLPCEEDKFSLLLEEVKIVQLYRTLNSHLPVPADINNKRQTGSLRLASFF